MAKKVKATAETFVYDKKQYKVLIHAANIPGIGVRTAAEILVDEDAQKYLVENGCVGSVIDESIADDAAE